MKTLKPKITIELDASHPAVKAYLTGLASRGGKAKAANMSREERVAMAKELNKLSQASKKRKKLEQAGGTV